MKPIKWLSIIYFILGFSRFRKNSKLFFTWKILILLTLTIHTLKAYCNVLFRDLKADLQILQLSEICIKMFNFCQAIVFIVLIIHFTFRNNRKSLQFLENAKIIENKFNFFFNHQLDYKSTTIKCNTVLVLLLGFILSNFIFAIMTLNNSWIYLVHRAFGELVFGLAHVELLIFHFIIHHLVRSFCLMIRKECVLDKSKIFKMSSLYDSLIRLMSMENKEHSMIALVLCFAFFIRTVLFVYFMILVFKLTDDVAECWGTVLISK